MSSDPIQTSYKKFHVPLDIKSKFNDLYEMYIAAASEEKLKELGIDGQEIFQVMFETDEGVEILLEGLKDKIKQLKFLITSGITQNEKKFDVPSNIVSKYNDLYEMYKVNVSEEKLNALGIDNPETFNGLFNSNEGVEILLEGLTTEKQLEFMKTSGIKRYSGGGRNRKRRSKKRRGNRRKSTRRRSRR